MSGKGPKRWIKILMDLDFFILARIFMPISHWIDYRFHKNQFDQAAATLSCGLAMNVAANVTTALHSHGMAWICVLSSAGLVAVYSNWLKKMGDASRKYEERPDMLSFEAKFFMVYMSPFRLGVGWMGITLMLLPWVPKRDSWIILLTSPWMVLIAASLYFAGCIPPNRPRREKKEWAWPRVSLATPT